MIIAVATIRVHPDKIDAYEARFREFLAKVRSSEPGTVFYDVGKSREEPNTYRVVEVYKDEAAKVFHLQTAHFAIASAALSPCIVDSQFVLHDTIS